MEDIAARDPSAAMSAIERLAPVYDQIERNDRGFWRPAVRLLAALLLNLLPQVYVRYYAHWLCRGEWYHADRTFAAFVEHADLAAPEVGVALAFVSGEETVQALRARLREPGNAAHASANRLWDCPHGD